MSFFICTMLPGSQQGLGLGFGATVTFLIFITDVFILIAYIN